MTTEASSVCSLCGAPLDMVSDEWTVTCEQCGTARWNPRWGW